MVYDPNVPASANEFVSVSQRKLLRNFQQIDRQYTNDHIGLSGSPNNQGKHSKISLDEQSGDPTTAANEQAIYTKDDSGSPEIYLAPESAGTVYKATKLGAWQPGLKVEATVTFDQQANIIEEPVGNPLSFNVASVAAAQPLVDGLNVWDDFIITFDSNISTADYYWMVNWVLRPPDPAAVLPNPINVQPFASATYSTSVTAGMIRLTGYLLNTSVPDKRSQQRVDRMSLIIYTRA